MPELPDVETFRRYFESTGFGRRIAAVRVTAPEMLEGVSAQTLLSRLKHRHFVRTHRHGKFLFARIDRDGWIVFHFGMTGFLKHYARPDDEPPHTRLRIDFTDGSHLAFDDQRKFGRISLTDDVSAFVEERRLGPDPLEHSFDFAAFKAVVGRRRGAIKAALMNQRVIAGIGNIYADEILFQAQMHPEMRLDRMNESSLRDLYRATTRVLRRAVRAQADANRMPRGYLLRDRHAGGRCPKCGRDLARLTVGMRTTYYCPNHQRKWAKRLRPARGDSAKTGGAGRRARASGSGASRAGN
jgi:formamidopyrimidine-DNA glycosylase